MTSVGEALIQQLEAHDVEVVFGIPGVHTVELYRGLADSNIRHVTPRHEQGAGFMADGYARVTGKVGVALVITGPGVTNLLTPLGQARADSVPVLSISSVNPVAKQGKGLGCLHELPDQFSTVSSVACQAIRVENSDELSPAMEKLFAGLKGPHLGPAHIEIPTDVAKFEADGSVAKSRQNRTPAIDKNDLKQAAERLANAKAPVIVAGGGMRFHPEALQQLSVLLDAPTVLTTNARGLMHNHDLVVPASPSLDSVRKLIDGADVVLALGTELGLTDYDMFANGWKPPLRSMLRVDLSAEKLGYYDTAMAIHADAGEFIKALLQALDGGVSSDNNGAKRAEETRRLAFDEIGDDMRAISTLLNVIRDTAPNSIIVGDSTQPVYAGNLYYDHDRPAGWFNAATGFGALGFGIPAAIGAAIGAPQSQVICLVGDGGAQFSLPELMTAVDEKLAIVFIIWNNNGYQEIETSMARAGVNVVGCDPTPPNFKLVAASCGVDHFQTSTDPESVQHALKQALALAAPVVVEIDS
ncbi:MAG: 5-guanidino-2-oxopentanoate decarboxylase [Hyphomicrobiales bacterium]